MQLLASPETINFILTKSIVLNVTYCGFDILNIMLLEAICFSTDFVNENSLFAVYAIEHF